MSCTICEINDAQCAFAAVMNSIVNSMRFGIESCCQEDFAKVEIKYSLAMMSYIQNPDTEDIILNQPVIISPVSFGDCCN